VLCPVAQSIHLLGMLITRIIQTMEEEAEILSAQRHNQISRVDFILISLTRQEVALELEQQWHPLPCRIIPRATLTMLNMS
jgi:hypothetical protein